MSSTPEQLVVSNTSPLLYLHQVGHIDLLRELYGRIRIPSAVRAELQAGAERGVSVPDLSALGWIDEQVMPDRILLPVVIDLGAGEAEAIALALSSPGSLLILDDRQGRRTPVIEALRETTMHLTPELIEIVLKEAGEA